MNVDVYIRGHDTFVSAFQSVTSWDEVKAIPGALGCDWVERPESTPGVLLGTCKNWPSGNTLALSAMVKALHQLNTATVRVTVRSDESAWKLPTSPAGWQKSSYGYADSYFSYTSRSLEELPADLPLTPGSGKAIDSGQDDYRDEPPDHLTVTATITVRSNGRVRIDAYADGQETLPSGLLDHVPALVGCNAKGRRAYEGYITADCRGLVNREPGLKTGKLSLSALVRGLRAAGVEETRLHVYPGADAKSIQPPAGWTLDHGRLTYTSHDPKDVPTSLTIPLDEPPSLARTGAQVLLVILGPALLGWILRLRHRRNNRFNWTVWFQWLQLAPFLYWITAVQPNDIDTLASGIVGNVEWLRLPVSVLVATVPMLLGAMASLFAMRPLVSRSSEGFRRLLRSQTLTLAAFQVPLALVFQSATAGSDLGSGMLLYLPIGYVIYRGLTWLQSKSAYRDVTPVDAGPLYERTRALAAKAGVQLSRLSILQTQLPEEINAYAISGGRVMVTQSLLRNLTDREVDAVVAHELGHHKAGHLGIQWEYLLWIGVIALAPVYHSVLHRYNVSSWLESAPLLTLLAFAASGLISQRREYAADRHAAELTGDAEGKIAALGRIAKVSGHPIAPGGWLASFMTHPSMEERALALGRRFGLADERALAVVRNPDEAYTDGLAPLARAIHESEQPQTESVFSLRARMAYVAQLRWLMLLVPLVCLSSLSALSRLFDPGAADSYGMVNMYVLTIGGSMVLGPPIALAILIYSLAWRRRRFIRQMRDRLAARLHPAAGAVFAGLHPGNGIRSTEGFAKVDFGFLTLENGWLCYRGEKFRFAIERGDILNLSIVAERFRWSRERRVEIDYVDGTFTLVDPADRSIEAVLEWLQQWRVQRSQAAEQCPESAPALPDLPGSPESRWQALFYASKEAGKLLVFAVTLSSFQRQFMLTVMWAPCVIFAYILPMVLWPNGLPKPRVVLAPAALQETEADATLIGAGDHI